MKKNLLIGYFILLGMIGRTQDNPIIVLSNVPEIKLLCGMQYDDKQKYMSRIRDTEKMIDDELDERRMAQKAKEKDYRSQAEANVAAQYSLSQSDIDKMKNSKNLSKDEREKQRREMADKMMMNSGGISMGEIDQIKGDTAAQKAWAQGYSTQKMAEQSFDPQKSQSEQKHNMSMYELTSIQKKLSDSLSAAEGKYLQKFYEMEQDTSGRKFLREIDTLSKKLSDLSGVDYGQGAEMEALFGSIKAKSLSYCVKYSSEYIDLLEKYRLFVSNSIPSWNRLQSITLKLNEMQTGIRIEEEEGTLALECIKRFVEKMGKSDQYYLMSQSAKLGGGED